MSFYQNHLKERKTANCNSQFYHNMTVCTRVAPYLALIVAPVSLIIYCLYLHMKYYKKIFLVPDHEG